MVPVAAPGVVAPVVQLLPENAALPGVRAQASLAAWAECRPRSSIAAAPRAEAARQPAMGSAEDLPRHCGALNDEDEERELVFCWINWTFSLRCTV